ncbi:MGDG synthase family glycosyltransferase [Solimicrobium silvestre]|uniref:Monogalactosyldiacylglycerol (MGDG) synthase n=1 Tax=Solimicrobium silvestre TaxID=2099400 RepID=A0A2S9GVD8_9BURK|nr:glycosyltransferase [Solimicrobium silvestre]PRC91671.1 Monogalactosyldiacylglycerol (MGDG) synthase [Solimicrobium silvestre]
MPQPRVLMISVSAGSGHVRAAEALLETSSQFSQPQFSHIHAQHIDVMSYVSRSFRGVYSDFYRHLINHAPALWAYLYKKTDDAQRSDISSMLRRSIEQLCTKKLIKKIAEFKPDHIICTHFLPAELLAREIKHGRLTCPVWVQVTDFDLHSLWVQPHMRGYFAANHEVAFKMRERGIANDVVHVTGIPVSPVFLADKKKHDCRMELCLKPELTTALILSGGARIGTVTEIAERLLRNNDTLQVIAVAGNNPLRLAELQQLAIQYTDRLVIFGFSKCIENLMAASDVVITKPGGLTSSECLIMGLPMLLVDPIPGQEERNGDYLMEQGAAVKAHDIVGLDFKIRQFIVEPERLVTMRQKMLAIAKPNAAHAVLTHVLER